MGPWVDRVPICLEKQQVGWGTRLVLGRRLPDDVMGRLVVSVDDYDER